MKTELIMKTELRMKKADCKRWIKALRSGKYKQGKGVLCSERGNYCCLGVYADVNIEGDWELGDRAWHLNMGVPGSKSEEIIPYSSTSSDEFEGIHFGAKSGQRMFAILNDKEWWSFDEIATWVEKNVLPRCS